MGKKNTEENLREMTELEEKGLGGGSARVHKGWGGVKREPQVSLPSHQDLRDFHWDQEYRRRSKR